VPERGQPGDSLVAHGLAAAAQALHDGVEVTGIPQHDGVEDQAEGGELILAFAIGLPDLAVVPWQILRPRRWRDSCTVSCRFVRRW
jgi:hypothetical protein